MGNRTLRRTARATQETPPARVPLIWHLPESYPSSGTCKRGTRIGLDRPANVTRGGRQTARRPFHVGRNRGPIAAAHGLENGGAEKRRSASERRRGHRRNQCTPRLEHFPFCHAGFTALRDTSNGEKPRGLKPAAGNTETENALNITGSKLRRSGWNIFFRKSLQKEPFGLLPPHDVRTGRGGRSVARPVNGD